jgi:hypothetical protein
VSLLQKGSSDNFKLLFFLPHCRQGQWGHSPLRSSCRCPFTDQLLYLSSSSQRRLPRLSTLGLKDKLNPPKSAPTSEVLSSWGGGCASFFLIGAGHSRAVSLIT